ncbi:MAG: TetR/AcrR family transcriptional regulator [bacterium]|nr:TetR/AcrR family transcriptional regulator [bacterium]
MEPEHGPVGTRDAILEAAEVLFGERGFSKTTLEDVAASAEVSRPLVYRYFGDKKGLFAVVVERVLREWNEVLAAEAARTTPGTAHTLRLVLEACLDFARTRVVMRGLLARDSRLALAHVGGVLERGRALLPELVQRILEDGVRRRDVRSDLAVEDMAHVISEVFMSYSLLVLAGGDEQVRGRRAGAVIETLLHGVIAAPEPLH